MDKLHKAIEDYLANTDDSPMDPSIAVDQRDVAAVLDVVEDARRWLLAIVGESDDVAAALDMLRDAAVDRCTE